MYHNIKNRKMTKYLQIAFAEGKLFEYSSTPKDEFVEHVGAKNGKTTYRKYYDKGFTGVFKSLTVVKNPNLGIDEIKVSFQDETNDWVNITFGAYNQTGDAYSEFAASFISQLDGMREGGTYTFSPYNFESESEDGTKRKQVGISIRNEEGEKLSKLTQAKIFKDGNVKEGDIPAAIWTVSPTGKPKKNEDERTIYLKSILDSRLSTEPVKAEQKPTTAQSTVKQPEAKKPSAIKPPTSTDTSLPF